MHLFYEKYNLEYLLTHFKLKKSVSEYIREDIAHAFDASSGPGSSVFLDEIVDRCEEKLEAMTGFEELNLSHDEKLACLCYTMDMQRKGASAEQDFFNGLNKILREGNHQLYPLIVGYLSYFVRAIRKLPTRPAGSYHFRGISRTAFDKHMKKNHKEGHIVQWRAISSVSDDVEVTKDFAEDCGVIFRITTVKGAPSLGDLSEFPHEKECLLQPDFHARVVKVWGKGELKNPDPTSICCNAEKWSDFEFVDLREVGDEVNDVG
jgi:hypothetical protein